MNEPPNITTAEALRLTAIAEDLIRENGYFIPRGCSMPHAKGRGGLFYKVPQSELVQVLAFLRRLGHDIPKGPKP